MSPPPLPLQASDSNTVKGGILNLLSCMFFLTTLLQYILCMPTSSIKRRDFFIYLFLLLVVLSLHCCLGFSPVALSGGLLSSCDHGLLIEMLLLLRSTHGGFSSCGFQALEHRLNNCGTLAQLLRGMWDLPRSGIKPMSPALTGGFIPTDPPGKP